VERIFVRGGNPLYGSVRVSGSKNSSLALMAACLLVKGKTTLRSVPDIRDIHTMAEMLREIGAEVRFSTDGDVEIDASGFNNPHAPEEAARRMRASFYVFGPMLARLGAARVAQPAAATSAPVPSISTSAVSRRSAPTSRMKPGSSKGLPKASVATASTWTSRAPAPPAT